MNTITPLTSSTGLGSATSRSSGQPPGQRTFHAGEFLKATVLETSGNDFFTLDIAGNRITAQSKATLSPGQSLHLQVVTLSPQVELKIVSNTPQQVFGHSLTLVGKNLDLSSLVNSLQQITGTTREATGKATVLEAKGNDVFILDIGGKQITAQSEIPLSPNQTLQLQMTYQPPQINVQIPSGIDQPTVNGPLSFIDDGTDFTSIIKTLPKGDNSPQTELVKATVLAHKGGDVYLLDIGGKQITAQSQTPLVAGRSLELEIISTLPQPKITIVAGTDSKSVGSSLIPVGDTAEIINLLQTLQPSRLVPLDSLSITSRTTLENFISLQQQTLSGKDGGETIKHLVDKIGLAMEHLLAVGDKENAAQTLKAALLETAHVFKEATDISKTTHQLLGTLETYQLAQLHMENAANFIFPLPLPFLEKGYLVVEDFGKQSEGEDNGVKPPMRFSLHLGLAELGNLRIDFLQYQDGLYIRFNTDSKEKSNFVESFSTNLKEALSTSNLLGLTFSENATDPASDLIKKILPQGSSMLDTTA